MLTIKRAIACAALFLICFLSSASAMAGFCTTAANAPQAKMNDAHVKRAIAIWQKVSAPFVAMTGRQTGLVILSKKAGNTVDGKTVAFKPSGRTCPGAPPVVYITWPLIKKVYIDKSYNEDFLAFVMGHELGHRINDLTAEGTLAGRTQKIGALNIEALADKRAAFFASLAGYSMSGLAKKDTVNTFLKNEYRSIPRGVLDERKFALNQTLRTFQAYEHLYETGVALAFSTETESAERLLALTDELLTGKTVPLPEVKILRAYTLMNSAASHAPWIIQAKGSLPDLDTLRCAPIFPQHTKLWPDIKGQVAREQGNLRGGKSEETLRKEAAARLKLASKLLDQAEDYRPSAFVLHHARACLAMYRDDPARARKSLALAQQTPIAKRGLTKPVKDAMAQNKALFQFALFLNTNAIPRQSNRKEARRWAKKLKSRRKAFKANAMLNRLVPLYTMYPTAPRAVATPKKPALCKDVGKTKHKKQNKTTPSMTLRKAPTATGKLGVCPAGWRVLHAIPQAKTKTSTQLGITTCVPKKTSATSARFVAIDLPGSMSPALPKVSLQLLFEDMPSTQKTTMAQASCGCMQHTYKGVSDNGQTVHMVVCPKRGLMPGLIYTNAANTVQRVVSIVLPELEDEDEDEE